MVNNNSISTTSCADASGTTMYAQYTYLGAGRIVRTTHPASANNLTLAYNTGGTGVYVNSRGQLVLPHST